MPRKPDTPCAGGCGKLLWRGTGSRPAGERKCRECRSRDGDSVRPRVELTASAETSAKRPHRVGRPWRRLREQVLAEETDCFRCGEPVDKNLPPNGRWSPSVDHVVDVSDGGAPLDRSNVRIAHHGCNGAAGVAKRNGTESGLSGAAVRDEERFATRGRALWRAMKADGATLGPMQTVLLEEACRIADRLDRLDALIGGDAADWLEMAETKGNPDRQEIVIDKVLAEARQYAIALKQIVSELRQAISGAQPVKGESVLDQLAAKRAQRLTNSAG